MPPRAGFDMIVRGFAARTAGAFAVLFLAGCFGESTGPGDLRHARLSLAPVFDSRAARLVEVSRVVIRLTRPGTGALVLEQVADFPSGDDELSLTLEVPISGSSEQFLLTLAMVGPAGDTVFRAGPDLVTASSSLTPAPVPTPELVYTGVGAGAAGVRFVAPAGQVYFGDPLTVVAEAYDGSGAAIPGAPLFFSSSDPARLAFADPAVGQAVAGTTRGPVQIIAELPRTAVGTPPLAAQHPLVVQPRASAIAIQSGNNQQGAVGAALSQPVTVRVNAADNLGVQGVTVTFAVVSGGGTLSTLSAATDANGDASVIWTLGANLGAQVVTASVPGLAGAVATVTATGVAGPPTQLLFQQQPTDANAGQPISPAVTVRAADALGNTVSTYTGAVTIALGANPGGATLGGTMTVAAVAGVATFNDLTLSAPSTGYTLTAAATGLAGATSVPFAVAGATPSQLVFDVQPTTVAAGSPIVPAVVVSVRDGQGNLVTSATDLVTIALGANPGGATLAGTVSVAAVAGVATFNDLSLDRAAAGYTLAASATGLTGGTSAAFTVTSAGPAQLVLTTPPSNAVAGAVIAPAVVVEVRDLFGNRVTAYGGALSIGLGTNPGGATLGGTTTVTAVAGVGTFADLTLDKAGTGYTLVADGAGATQAVSAPFDIVSGAAATLHFQVQPTNTVEGQAIAPPIVVVARDALGNTATGFTGGVTIGFGANPGGATLGGTTTVAAIGGIATFSDLSVSAAGAGYTLTAAATGVTGATSNAFSVAGVNPTQLVFVVQPPTSGAGAILSPAVEVHARDALGNTITSYTGTVSLAFDNNPGGAILSGTTAVAAVAGVASFSTLSITTQGAGYTLRASAAGLPDAISLPFNITALTQIWTNPAGGSWSNPANWSLGRVPQTTDSVVITLPGTYTVVLDTTFSASFIVVGDGGTGGQTLSLNSRTLTTAGALIVQPGGTFSAVNSVLDGVGPVLNLGTVSLLHTTISAVSALVNQNLLLLNGTVNVNGGLAIAAGSTVRLQPDGSTGFTNLNVATGFQNDGTLELTSAGSTYSAQVTTGVLVNGATGVIAVLPGTGGTRTLAARLLNSGTVTVSQPLTLNASSAAHSNLGTMDLSGGGITVFQSGTSPSFSNGGTILIGAGQVLQVNSGQFNQLAGATIGGSGTLSLSALVANFATDFDNAVTGLVASGTTFNGPGMLTNAAGATLALLNVTLDATLPFVNNGTLVANGTVNVNGPVSTAAGSVLRVQPDGSTGFSNLTMANGFTNNGLIELTAVGSTYASSFAVTAGTLVNAASGVISIIPGPGGGGGRTFNAQFDNQGTITVAHPVNMNRTSTQYLNSGLVDLTGGSVSLGMGGTAPSFTNTAAGTITIGAGLTFFVFGGTLQQDGTVDGPGTLAFSGATGTFSVPFSNAVTALSATSSTLNGPGTLTNAAGRTLTLTNVTVNATMPIVNNGILVTNATVNINGAFTAPAGSTLRLQPDGSTGFSNLTFATGFTNDGTIELTSVGSTYSASLAVTAGTLLNSGTGVILSAVGAGGARTLNAELDNQGTVTVAQLLTMNRGSSNHVNSGTVDLTTASLTFNLGGTSSFTNSAAITIGAGQTLQVNNGTFNQAAGTLSGAGTLGINSATVNFTTDFDNATTALVVANATLNGPGTLTNAAGRTLTLHNVTVAASMPLVNNGLLVTNATVNVNGSFTAPVGTTLRLQPDGSTGFTNLTFANGFTNDGTIELTSVGSTYSASLAVSAGTLLNSSTGVILSAVGAGGARTLTAELNNQGTVTVAQALNLNRAASNHLNSGTVDLTTGSLTLNMGGTATFTNSAAVTIGAGQTLSINNGTFTQAAGALSGAGTLAINTATVNFTTDFDNATTLLSVVGATLNGPGTLTNAAGRTLSLFNVTLAANLPFVNQGTLLTNATVNINGGLTTAAGSTIRLVPDGSTGFSTTNVGTGFTNLGTIELTAIGSTYNATLNVTGTLLNSSTGVIQSLSGSGGTRNINAQLDNQSLLSVDHGLTLGGASADHVNSGTIAVAGGSFTINQTGTTPTFLNNGTITVSPGLTLSVTGGTFTQAAAATLDGGGALSTSGAVLDMQSTYTLGAVTLTGGTAATFANAVSTASAIWSLSSATINAPSFTNDAGQTTSLFNVVFGATTPVTNLGTFVTNHTVTFNAALVNGTSGILRLQPDGSTGFNNVNAGAGLTNDGAIELTAVSSTYSASLVVTGTLLNSSTGTITSLVGSGGARTITAQLDNQGTLTVDQGLLINGASADHVNGGTVNVSGGNLTVTQSATTPTFTNNGTLTVAPGRTLTINSGVFTQPVGGGATLDGGGALALNGVTSDIQTGFTLGGVSITGSGVATFGAPVSTAGMTWTLSGGTMHAPAGFTNAVGVTMPVSFFTFGPTTPVVNQGTMVLNAGVTVNGTLATAPGSVIRVQPDGSTGFAQLTTATGFTNSGTLELTSIVSTYSSSLFMNAGTLINDATGVIASLPGTGGTRTITAQLDNQGLVLVSHPLAIGAGSADHLNSGTFDVSGGDLTINQSGTTPSFLNTNVITVAAGRLLTVNGGAFTNQSGATLDGGGAFAASSVTLDMQTPYTLGAVSLTGATIATFANAVNTTSEAWTLNNATVHAPSFTNAAGQTTSLFNVTFGPTTPVTNLGTFVTNHNVTFNAAFANGAGGVLRLQPDGSTGFNSVTAAAGLTNDGAIEMTSTASTYAATLAVTGTLLNNASGTITSMVGTGGARTLTAQLDNQGLITVDQPLVMNATSADHLNSGTINVNGANLTVTQGGTTPTFTNNGTIMVGTGRTLTFNNGFLTHAGGATLGGTGALTLTAVAGDIQGTLSIDAVALQSSSNLTFAQPVTTTGPWVVSNAIVNASPGFTNGTGQTLTLQLATFGVGTPVTNNGTIVVTASSAINGVLTTGPGSTLRVSPTGSFTQLSLNSAFTNTALVELTSATNDGASINMTGSTQFTNAPGGTITTLAGGGGARSVSAPTGGLVNQGTINIVPGAAGTLSVTGPFANSGVLNLELGGTTPGTLYDRLAVTLGATTLGGTLNVALFGGFVPAPATLFDVLTFPSATGSIATFNPPGGGWSAPAIAGSGTVLQLTSP